MADSNADTSADSNVDDPVGMAYQLGSWPTIAGRQGGCRPISIMVDISPPTGRRLLPGDQSLEDMAT